MTRQEANTYQILASEARWLRERIESMRATIDSPRIPELTGMPGSHYASSGSAQERAADRYMDSMPQYEARYEDVMRRLRRIENAIDKLPDRERVVANWHIVNGMSYKVIASELDLSPSRVGDIMSMGYKLLEAQDEIDRR